MLDRDLDTQLAGIDAALLRLDSRAQRFIDTELAFSNIFALLNAAAVRERFEEMVAAPAAKEKAPAAEGSEEDAGDDVAEKPSVFPFSKDLNEKIVLWYVR